MLDYAEGCERFSARRIDCEVHIPEDEEDGLDCLETVAYRLFAGGTVFRRSYGKPCHRAPAPFERDPEWTTPWRSAPL